jgi:hypothetical protein
MVLDLIAGIHGGHQDVGLGQLHAQFLGHHSCQFGRFFFVYLQFTLENY